MKVTLIGQINGRKNGEEAIGSIAALCNMDLRYTPPWLPLNPGETVCGVLPNAIQEVTLHVDDRSFRQVMLEPDSDRPLEKPEDAAARVINDFYTLPPRYRTKATMIAMLTAYLEDLE